MGHKNPVIGEEFAERYGFDIETVKAYSQRLFIDKTTAYYRIKRNRCYGFKVNSRWFIVTKNGQDLRDIIV